MKNHDIAELLDHTFDADRRSTNQALQQLANHLTIEQITKLQPAYELATPENQYQ